MKKLKIGDTVRWKGDFGMASSKDAIVQAITKITSGKDGNEVESVLWEKFVDRKYIVDLDNDHWAWASQIKKK